MSVVRSNEFLIKEKPGTLMRKYAVPCIISLLVAALYNIVDQIFIANAAYLGSYGNAANTVVFPLTVVALAIAVMIGDGTCAFVSISLGANRNEDAHRSIGSAVIACVVSSIVLTAFYLVFMNHILTLFGGTNTLTSTAYWGGNVVVSGIHTQLALRDDGNLSKDATLSISTDGGATIDIASGGKVKTGEFWVNGSKKDPGIYTAANLPGVVTGAGRLVVGTAGTMIVFR